MCETVSAIPEEIDEQTRFVSEVCYIEKTKSGKLFSSTSRPRRDYMQSIRSRRAALTVVADLPRFVFSPENIDTNLCMHIFHGFFQPPHRLTASLNRGGRQHQLSSVGSLPSVILLICMGEIIQDASGECRRQGFASGIYVCKKHSADSPDDDCERNAEKADGDTGLLSRT